MKVVIDIPKVLYDRAKKPPILGMYEAIIAKGVPLDKIRAEIEHIIDYTPDSIDYDESLYNGAYRNGLYKALDIVDKYREGSEEV